MSFSLKEKWALITGASFDFGAAADGSLTLYIQEDSPGIAQAG